MRPVVLPQYVPSRIASANSIMNVVRAICQGLNGVGGRILAPTDTTVFGYGAETFGHDLTQTNCLTDFSMALGPTFKPKLAIEEDEYVVNVTPYLSFLLYRQTRIKDSMFSKPKILNYVLFAPNEVDEGHREICVNLVEYPSIFNSEHNRRLWLDECRKCISSADIRKMIDNSDVVHIGIGCDELDSIPYASVPGSFAYCGRMATHKGFDKTLEILSKVFSTGTNLSLLVSTFGKSSCERLIEAAKEHKFVVPHYDLPRDKYLQLIHKTDGWKSVV